MTSEVLMLGLPSCSHFAGTTVPGLACFLDSGCREIRDSLQPWLRRSLNLLILSCGKTKVCSLLESVSIPAKALCWRGVSQLQVGHDRKEKEKHQPFLCREENYEISYV